MSEIVHSTTVGQGNSTARMQVYAGEDGAWGMQVWLDLNREIPPSRPIVQMDKRQARALARALLAAADDIDYYVSRRGNS